MIRQKIVFFFFLLLFVKAILWGFDFCLFACEIGHKNLFLVGWFFSI